MSKSATFQHQNVFVGKKDWPFGKEFQVSGPLLLMVLQIIPVREVSRWTNVGGPIPASDSPSYSSSDVTISRIKTQYTEGSDELDSEEAEVVAPSIGHLSSNSPTKTSTKKFHSQVISSNPRTFQPVLSTVSSSIHPPSPNPSTSRPSIASPIRPSHIPHPRPSQFLTSQQSETVARTSRRREDQSPFSFPATQVCQRREFWPIRDTREDPNVVNEGKYALSRSSRRVDRNSREVITYTNDRMIPGTASEEMASKFFWYEYELINYSKRTFDDMGRDN
ncbi:hypothetical protein O181_048691 [Austropuccinia psidii MF-1]|uniref:Uncharacterized protein n=1 Tax=Austropuccinia psidii MF-1 TaxID=1389203 RepID=A0A9Q3HKM7_9BASI|nr:hypothetical protein [Austropuccinia psidii MF-1]